MSGDVQPRKRKDKKKQKDEGDGFTASNEDLNIHIYKDGATGGNICSKIVFFMLLSALAVLIGLIIRENQGLNELESLEQESRYAQIFEKWIDQNPEEHDDHSPELHDHNEDDNHEEEDGESDESDVAETEEGEEEEEEQSQEVDDDDDPAEGTEEEHSQEDEEEEEESTQISEEEEDSSPRSEEATEESEEVPQSEEDETVDGRSEEESDEQEVENSEQIHETEDNESDETDKTEEVEIKALKDKDKSDEEVNGNEDLTSKEKSEKSSRKVEADELNEKSDKEQDEVAAEKQSDENNESSGMTTKIVVGLALLAVAYNVFLRKRRSDIITPSTKTTQQKEPTPDLSRRNTIIPPPSLLEVEPDLPEDNEMEDQEYSEDEFSDEDSRSEHRSPKEEYQDLRTTYSRSMTPEGEFEVKNKQFEEDTYDEEIEEEEMEEEEIDDDDDDDYEKFDEDDDEELLKRLEAKYGRLGREVNVGEDPESESDKEDYERSNITNKADFAIKEDIDAAQGQLHKNAAYANKMFEALLEKYPLSPRLLYGRAKALDVLAEEKKSNELLKQSLSYYLQALSAPDVPDQLIINIAERYIDRARFIGQYKKAVVAHLKLIERFPENATYLNNLAVTYLTINLVEEARSTLKKVLSKWPNDGLALVHYGFILKTADNNLEDSIQYMSQGLQTKAPGVVDGRFYFQLGDALTRLNRNNEAINLYEEGVQQGLFKSKFQRSLYNVDRLPAKPWWESRDLPSYQKLFTALRENWQQIRQEGTAALNKEGHFRDEAENLKDTGIWKQLELFARGQKFSKNCARSPVTCDIIQNFEDASGCRRGQTKFSVMHPGTHVWPHCGPTNCRLRVHLGLKVPPNTFIRVAEEIRAWKEGDIIIFDDSFEHEVWHNGTELRLVLIVDVWHPNLTPTEKKTLSSI